MPAKNTTDLYGKVWFKRYYKHEWWIFLLLVV